VERLVFEDSNWRHDGRYFVDGWNDVEGWVVNRGRYKVADRVICVSTYTLGVSAVEDRCAGLN